MAVGGAAWAGGAPRYALLSDVERAAAAPTTTTHALARAVVLVAARCVVTVRGCAYALPTSSSSSTSSAQWRAPLRGA